jgi:hypothetical protein
MPGFRVYPCRLSYLAVEKFRIVVETRRKRPRIVRNRCVPVCGYRAGHFGLGLAQLQAQIRFETEDSRPDPYKFSGPFQLSRVEAHQNSMLETVLWDSILSHQNDEICVERRHW